MSDTVAHDTAVATVNTAAPQASSTASPNAPARSPRTASGSRRSATTPGSPHDQVMPAKEATAASKPGTTHAADGFAVTGEPCAARATTSPNTACAPVTVTRTGRASRNDRQPRRWVAPDAVRVARANAPSVGSSG